MKKKKITEFSTSDTSLTVLEKQLDKEYQDAVKFSNRLEQILSEYETKRNIRKQKRLSSN